MTQVSIQEKMCWICNENPGNTTHHALPKHLRPKKNITVPICSKCHNKINQTDLAGLYAYIHKVYVVLADARKSLGAIKKVLDLNLEKQQEEQKNIKNEDEQNV